MRTPIIAANWKMYKNRDGAKRFIHHLRTLQIPTNVDVVIAPPFTLLDSMHEWMRESSLSLAGQNLYPASEGPYTGEISPKMLKELGCLYVILGHSERRQHFGESDQFILQKVLVALEDHLTPILCVGETLKQRGENRTEEAVTKQLKVVLNELRGHKGIELVIAYEPVWAIGTGQTASPADAQSGAKLIRTVARDVLGGAFAERLRVQYGGSVKPENAVELLSQADVDGALVGGASLDPDSFHKIINASRKQA